jgi:signal transduction histidine kinase
MSAAAQSSPIDVPESPTRRREARVLFLAFVGAWGFVLATLVVFHAGSLLDRYPEMLLWIALQVAVNLVPLRGWHSAPFTADDPVSAATALVFDPVATAVILFVGALDTRELRGQTTLLKALWNRSHVSFDWFLGSFAAHAVVQNPASSKWIVLLAFLILFITTVVNYLFVGTSIALEFGYAFKDAVRRLKLGALVDFVLAFVAWAVLAGMLVALYDRIGGWALVAFLGPILLSRQVLERSQAFIDTERAYRSTEMAFQQLTHQIDQERNDERRLIAADLHDEVLPPLFQVSLMAHVLRADLDSGRLLDLERDLPDVLEAASTASASLRTVIGDLRRSGLGRGGVASALSRLTEVLGQQSTVRFVASLAPVESDSVEQLVLYQIGKEALNNAMIHSQAQTVWIELAQDEEATRLLIRDDGRGFDPYTAREGHYGIHMMRERAASIGASFFLDSSPNSGCNLTVLVPRKLGPRKARLPR